jgi:hypothetical protein
VNTVSINEVARSLSAKRAGGQWLALCPTHDDSTPSLALRVGANGKLLARCHAGCDQDVVVAELKRRGVWPETVRNDAPAGPGFLSNAEKTAKARTIWQTAIPAAGTLAEVYLRSRAITVPVPPTLRFAEGGYHAESGHALPALIAAVTVHPSNTVVAVQRTYLRSDGKGKAAVSPAKKGLGPIRGGAVRLAKCGHRLGLAEGIEDALSVLQIDPSLPCWAVLGATNLASVELPPLPLASEVVLIADNDGPGMKAAHDAARRFRSEGRSVRIATPPAPFKDFNEALQAEQPTPAELEAERRYVREERTAIAEYDGGLPRSLAETLAKDEAEALAVIASSARQMRGAA